MTIEKRPMDIDITIQHLSQKIAEIESAYAKLNELLYFMEGDLKKSFEDECALNKRLKELLSKKIAGNGKHPGPGASTEAILQEPVTEVVDPTAQLEKLLQGTLDVLGDKISERLMGMLKEFKALPVDMRASRIHEVKQVADAELIDLSGLYKHEQVQSNIDDVGVTETESKSIDKNLEKLRMLRQSRIKN